MPGPKIIHGLSASLRNKYRAHPIYASWQDMLTRIRNPKKDAYSNYGGRGIKVCERWYKFKNFYDDMVFSWRLGLTLHRINNDGDYEVGNCKWATYKEQAQNRRKRRWHKKPATTRGMR